MSNAGSKAVKQSDKILYIEPNDLPAFLTAKSVNGDPLDNIAWNPEDLNISVDLQVVIPSRQYNPSELKEYGDFDFNDAKYQSILSGVKLDKNGSYLTDDWTVMSYQEIKNNRSGSKEMLGINSIQITFDSHMYPRVTMNFTDVRGSSLMQPQEQRYLDLNGQTRDAQTEATKNFFANLFKFPYPRFLLSVKGIYGTCVTFVLSVEDFKSTFNSETGNFDVIVRFIGNMFGLYTDIPMNYLLIAPYISSKSGGFTKNEYWLKQTENGGAFHYNEDGQQGAPISTFLEFFTQYHRAVERQEISNAYGKNISKMATLTRESSLLTGPEGIVTKFYDYIPWMLESSIDSESELISGNTNVSKNVVFYSENVTNVLLDDDFVENGEKGFKAAVEAYKKEFPNGFFSNGKTYMNVSSIYNYGQKSYPTSKVDLNADIICPGLTKSDSEYIKSLKPEIKDKFKYAFVFDKSFREDVENYVKRLENECSDKMEGASKEVENFFKEIFQFTPTIENVMRMVFAHLDCFINSFYAVVSQIKGTRTLGSLGNFPKELTDIESSSGNNAHVPPYTGFYRQQMGGKIERMYPGEDMRLANIPEVAFVEEILNGIGSMTEWQADYLKEEDSDFSDGDEENIEMDFIPGILSDIYYEGKNPYEALRGGGLYAYDLLYFFLCRLYQYHISGGRDEKKFAQAEANNFIKSSAFKDFSRKNGFKELVDNTLSNFWNSTFYNICYETGGWPFSFTNGTYPIYKITERDDKIKYFVEPDESKKLPMKFNGIYAPDESCTRASKLGMVNEEFSEDYISKFSDKIFGFYTKTPFDINFSYESFPIIKNYDDYLLVVPLNYVQKENGDCVYFPVTEGSGKNLKVKAQFAKFKFNNLYKMGEGAKPEKATYSGYDDFLKNADERSMWVPSVRWKDGNKKENLLINFTNNPLSAWDEYGSALAFLYAMLFGYNDKAEASKSLPKDMAKFFSKGVDKCVKMSRAEYLFICGLAYANTNDNVTSTYVAHLKSALKGILSNDEMTRMASEFRGWASGEFKTNIADVVKSYNQNNNWGIASFNFEGTTVNVDGGLEVAEPGTSIQQYVISLYRDTVTPFRFAMPRESEKSMSIEEGKAASIFFKKVGEELAKMNTGGTENATYNNGTIEVSLEFNDDTKNSIYYTLKNLYDRWLSMQTHEDFRLYSVDEENDIKREKMTNGGRLLKDRSEFVNFIYVDSFYNDISKKFMVNPEKLFKLLRDQFDGTVTYNILEFIGRLCQDNKLLFRCLPVYSNVYSVDTFSEIFTPHSLYDGSTRTGRRIGNTYMIMYTYEPSHFLNIEQDKSDGVNYNNDSFDIADSFGDITQESLEIMRKKNDAEGGTMNYSVCAFGVTAAKQNQSYFTKISVGMDNPRVTDYSIMNKFMLANLSQRGGTSNGVGVGQDMYSVYSNRSYDCSVEMLGCANIMPMMYFQLNNVPMFKGVYMITKVEHSIQNNTMVTKFVGTRMPKNYIPLVNNVFSIEALNEAINRIASTGGFSMDVGNVTVHSDLSGSWTSKNADGAPSAEKSSYEGKTFYVGSALAQMKQLLYGKAANWEGCKIPIQSKSNGVCATFVMYYLNAGFNGVIGTDNNDAKAMAANGQRVANRFNNCNGYHMKHFLAKNGFVVVATKSDMPTFSPQDGDVCVMDYGGWGHVCMWSSDVNDWVSDYKQGNKWCPGNKVSSLKNYEAAVIVYRFGGTRSKDVIAYGETPGGIIKAKDGGCPQTKLN